MIAGCAPQGEIFMKVLQMDLCLKILFIPHPEEARQISVSVGSIGMFLYTLHSEHQNMNNKLRTILADPHNFVVLFGGKT